MKNLEEMKNKITDQLEEMDNSKLNPKQVKSKYKAAKRWAEDRETEKAGKTNCYRCTRCHHIEKYRYADSGVTPFITNCCKCGEISQSQMGTDIAPELNPTKEWYRPSLKYTMAMRGKWNMIFDHILNGGLIPRPIDAKKEESPTV